MPSDGLTPGDRFREEDRVVHVDVQNVGPNGLMSLMPPDMAKAYREGRLTTDMPCRCNGTGWVKVSIPPQFRAEYDNRTWGWAGCSVEEHLLSADSESPSEETERGEQ